jgi:membrane-associated phospholipid phosphatase
VAVRNPRTLLLLAATCGLAFSVLLVLAYTSAGARSLDASALQGFIDLQGDRVGARARRGGPPGAPPGPVIVLTAALAALAAARGRLRQAAAIIFLVGATSVSSQLLKVLLAYPRDPVGGAAHVNPAAFPSGHSTAAMTLAACAVLVAPRAVRPIAAALGALLALGVGYSVVTLGWHYPSDVIGGFLLATIWTLVVAAALQAAERRWPERVGRTRVSAALTRTVDRVTEAGVAALALAVAAVGSAAALLVAVRRMDDVREFASAHTAAVVVGLFVAGSAAVLLAGVTLALRRRE